MSKELWGDPPKNPEMDSKYLFLNTHKSIISDILSNAFFVDMHNKVFNATLSQMCGVNELAVHISDERNLYFDKATSNQLSFYYCVYALSSGKPSEIKLDQVYFNQYHQKIIELLSFFYEDVKIIYMADGFTNRRIDKFYSKLFLPRFKLEDFNIRITGVRPKYASFSHISSFHKIEKIDFICDEDNENFLSKFFDKYNEHIVPKECDIKLSHHTELELLKEQLNIISMLLI